MGNLLEKCIWKVCVRVEIFSAFPFFYFFSETHEGFTLFYILSKFIINFGKHKICRRLTFLISYFERWLPRLWTVDWCGGTETLSPTNRNSDVSLACCITFFYSSGILFLLILHGNLYTFQFFFKLGFEVAH